MSNRCNDKSRRHFLKTTAIGVAALPVASLVFQSNRAHAEELPRLDEDSPEAQAVDYVHDAADAADHPNYAENELCSNCALYTGDEGDTWGGCAIFPGQLVAADGWCSVWSPAA